MKVAIIGAGWYGCHIGSLLAQLDIDVHIYEEKNDILRGASGANQFRLHAGFHYARNYRTRKQSADGFEKFKERYPNLSRPIQNNFYAIPTGDSIIDFQTYKAIMSSSGLSFTDVDIPDWMTGISGCIRTHEEVILTEKARQHFKSVLGDRLFLGKRFEDSLKHEYDRVIDCTWGSRRNSGTFNIFYEPCVLLVMSNNGFKDTAITMVDGDLCSVYPMEEENSFTMSSVPYTPIGTYSDFSTALEIMNSIGTKELKTKRKLIENQVSKYVKDSKDHFTFLDYQLSIKTKIVGSDDDRSCYVFRDPDDPKTINVLSGKIDNIFYAADSVLNLL